jgi:UDP-2,3-diacylglucosamine pyrophosphatase LpxH
MPVLNGDTIDMWSFSKSYFPESHMNVLRQIIKMSNQKIRFIYNIGNHGSNEDKIINNIVIKILS